MTSQLKMIIQKSILSVKFNNVSVPCCLIVHKCVCVSQTFHLSFFEMYVQLLSFVQHTCSTYVHYLLIYDFSYILRLVSINHSTAKITTGALITINKEGGVLAL